MIARKTVIIRAILFILLLPLVFSFSDVFASGTESHHDLGSELPLWSAIPFVGILISIAIFPLVAPHFWHHHFPKISAAWAIIFALPFLFIYKGIAFYEIMHIYLVDYFPFIILLFGWIGFNKWRTRKKNNS